MPFAVLIAMLSASPQPPDDVFIGEDAAFNDVFPSDISWYRLARHSDNSLLLNGEPVLCDQLPAYMACLQASDEKLWLWTGAGALLLQQQKVAISDAASRSALKPSVLALHDACDNSAASVRWSAIRELWLSRPWKLMGELGLSSPGTEEPGYGIVQAPLAWLNELGLSLGDRITAVNGLPLDSRHIGDLANRLVDARQFSLTLWRDHAYRAVRYCTVVASDA